MKRGLRVGGRRGGGRGQSGGKRVVEVGVRGGGEEISLEGNALKGKALGG